MTGIAYGPGEDPLNALYTVMGALDEAALASALADWAADWSDTRSREDPDDGAAESPEQDVVLVGKADDAGDGGARASEHGAGEAGGFAKGSAPDGAADRAAPAELGSTTPNAAAAFGSGSTAPLQALDAEETEAGSPASQATANTGGSDDTDEPNDVDPTDTDGPGNADNDGTGTGVADETGDADPTDTDGPDDTDTDDAETGETETGEVDEAGDANAVEPETADGDDPGSRNLQIGELDAPGDSVADASEAADADTGTGGDAVMADIALLLHLQELDEASHDPAPALPGDLADPAALVGGTDLTLYAASTDVPASVEHDLW